VLLIAVG